MGQHAVAQHTLALMGALAQHTLTLMLHAVAQHTLALMGQHAVAQHPSPNGALGRYVVVMRWMFGCGGQPPALGFAEDGIYRTIYFDSRGPEK
ncbi:hypothetical protein HaLaN_18783 [Haematococcus lacustris]|uniref:Uncharacterized protein n=1 Tax=Haematococcus lacustris TaxID=44745 RepID=A0A699ZZA0_HAELA|nr:hypothetical protein HaLaN_18783 [Haematococcus lacustris]